MNPHDTPSDWLDAFNRLSPHTAPCPGFRNESWSSVHAAAKQFLTVHAQNAYRLGWTGPELFGVHIKVGATRVDVCGALMVGGGALVTKVDADVIAFENGRFFRTPPTSETVLAWRWGK